MRVANEVRFEQEQQRIYYVPNEERQTISQFAEPLGVAFQPSAGTLSPIVVSAEMLRRRPFEEAAEYVRLTSSDTTSGRIVGVRISGVSPRSEDYPSLRDSFSGRSASLHFTEAVVAQANIKVLFGDIALEPQFGGIVSSLIVQAPRIEVYPGFAVTREEYQRRFGGVDLDYFRKHMKPDMFRSFVQSMGTVRGVRALPDRRFEEYEH